MSKTKQTAVEWLIGQIAEKQNGNGSSISMDEIFEKAKQIEKEQIETAWCEGNESEPKEVTMDFAEQHYTQTYHAFKGELIQDEIGNLKPKNYGK